MIPARNISAFIRKNGNELQSMVVFICGAYNYKGPYEDIVQDIYVKILTSNILRRFDYKRAKISTFLYPTIKNHVITSIKNPEYKISRRRLPDCETSTGEFYDGIIHHYPVAVDYQTVVINNNTSESYNGLGEQIRDFIKSFSGSNKNKKHSLTKRKNKEKETTGYSLLDVFHYLYEGYNNNEIAELYGVTPMSISHIKQQLAQAMATHGF